MRGVDDLDRLQAAILNPVEQSLAGAEHHRHEVERELIDRAGRKCLADSSGTACDVHVTAAGCGLRLLPGSAEAIRDEVDVVPSAISIGSCV